MFGLFSKRKSIPLWFKTDIHCHVLPGIDDGSPDVETSLRLIDGLKSLGVERIIASPHVAAVEFPNTPETVAASFGELDKAMKESGTDIPVSYSAEYRIDEELSSHIAEKRLMPYPDDYVLIENQWIQEPWNLEDIIFDLQIKGYQPIFAHPERFVYYHRNPARLDELHHKLPFQINLLSLAGYYGKDVQKMAESLLKKGYCDFLGTDTHADRHIEHLQKYLSTSLAEKHRDLSLKTLQNDKVFLRARTK